MIFGFGKQFPKPFFFSYTKTYTNLRGVLVNGIIKSLNRFSLSCFSPIDIYSLGSLHALVPEQYRNILNRYTVIVENTRYRMAKTVNRTVRQSCLFCQTVDHSVYSTEVDIRLTENGSDYKAAAFVVAVAEYCRVFILPFLFSLQCLEHGIVERYFAVTAFRFWCCNLSGYRLKYIQGDAEN